jgi:hypothetical protein
MAKVSPSALGRLLEEISWEGNARHYRLGGQGYENVLTAEVLQALDFLPRTKFLGRLLSSEVDMERRGTLDIMANDAEQVTFSLLPGGVFLEPYSPSKSPLEVQPDAILESRDVYCLVEAKRIRSGSFQPEQLAREYVCSLQHARRRKKKPLLLLILPTGPKVLVNGLGRVSVDDAVVRHMASVLRRTNELAPAHELTAGLKDVVAFTTWRRIDSCLRAGREQVGPAAPSLQACVNRLIDSALNAIEWHGRAKQPPSERMQPTRQGAGHSAR